MSNRTLIELNHDYGPGNDPDKQMEWASAIDLFLSSGDPRYLPPGVTFLGTRHHSQGCAVQTLADLRKRGWDVATHNDYRIRGQQMTFWLLTNPETGRFVKGEGATDGEALKEAFEKVIAMDNSRARGQMRSK